MQNLPSQLKKATEVISVVIMCVMSLMVFINVVLRYSVNMSIVSSEELSRFLFVWLTFLSAVLAYQEKSHICVDYVVKRLGEGARRYCGVIVNALILICCGLIIKGSYALTLQGLVDMSPVTEIPMATLYVSGILGGLGMAVIAAIRIGLGLMGREV